MNRVWFENFHDLNELKTAELALKDNCRDAVKILIVDDDDFLYLNELRNAKFNITKVDDIQDLLSVSEYPIVICDIKGVGKKFGSPREGIFVVDELKKKYPFKQYAIYSGSMNQFGLTTLPQGVVPINKDINIEEWIRNFDELIRKVTDPMEVWKTIRAYLLSKDVALLSILRLENEYVKVILTNPKDLATFPSQKSNMELASDVRAVVQSLVAGVLLSLSGL